MSWGIGAFRYTHNDYSQKRENEMQDKIYQYQKNKDAEYESNKH